MSAADSLEDARREIRSAHDAIKRGNLDSALVFFAFANRAHALALATHAILGRHNLVDPPPDEMPGAREVDEAIGEVRQALTTACQPKRAEVYEVVDAIAEGITVLRSLHGVPLTDEQIADRARNIGQALTVNFSVNVAK